MAKVSVIIPIFNAGKYLETCMNSVLKQTLKDIEIICVNDGSTDDSLSVLKNFQKQDSRIKIIDKKNSGYGDSLNQGFSKITGEFVAIVEPDDYIDKNMFKFLYDKAKKFNLDVVKSDFIEFSGKKSKYIMTPTHHSLYNRVLNAKTTPEIFNFKMNTWTGLYKTEFLKANNIFHNTTPGASYQDNGFWFQTLSLATSVMFVSRAFYHYRQDNPNSSINSKDKVFCICAEYAFIEEFLKAKHLNDTFFDWFLLKKFHNYIYTYSRISEENKSLFLQRFAEEFAKHNLEKKINTSIFNTQNKLWLEQILSNPQTFSKNFKSEDMNKFEPVKENKFKKLFSYIRLFGLKNTIKIIKK